MVFENLREDRFWIEWEDKFESDSNSYITPQNPEVMEASDVAMPVAGSSKETIARSAWDYVYEQVSYVLSEEWKYPAKTLREGKGDCEDVTFLIASMLPNMGIKESELVIGELEFPDGTTELHTWNEVDGTVIDATGSQEASKLSEYTPETTYKIVSR